MLYNEFKSLKDGRNMRKVVLWVAVLMMLQTNIVFAERTDNDKNKYLEKYDNIGKTCNIKRWGGYTQIYSLGQGQSLHPFSKSNKC